MDAFAVSVCRGLSTTKMQWKKALWIALWFGFFQAFMPLLGFTVGNYFQEMIVNVDHWITFIILSGLGIHMIKETFSNEERNYRGRSANKRDSIT